MSSESSNQLSSIKRFTIGLLIGIIIAGLSWLCSIYFHVSISLVQGIIGSLVLAICCGIIATISGLDKLFEFIENLPS